MAKDLDIRELMEKLPELVEKVSKDEDFLKRLPEKSREGR